MIAAFMPPSHRRRGFTLIEVLVVIGIILLLVALTVTVGTGMLRQSEVRETENTIRLLDIALQEWESTAGRQLLYGLDNEPCPSGPEERYELQQVGETNNVTHGFSWPNENAAFNDALYTTDRLWAVISRTSNVKDVIARVSPDYVQGQLDVDMHTDDALRVSSGESTHPTFRFLDAWDREIIAVFPGRPHDRLCEGNNYTVPGMGGQNRPDNDGTIRTPFENRYGAATDRRIYFVSAGPSGVFGNLHLGTPSGSLSQDQQEDIRDAEDNIYSYPVLIDQGRAQ